MRTTARGRTWTLAELDRAGVFRLWFDSTAGRWEVRPIEDTDGTLVTLRARHRATGRRDAQRSERPGDRSSEAPDGP